MNSELVFTSAAVLELLANIEELSDKDIRLEEKSSGFDIIIGNVAYEIKPADAIEVAVGEDAVEEIAEYTDEAIEDINEDDEFAEEVEGGVLKEIAKSLLLGGMLKLTSKILKN